MPFTTAQTEVRSALAQAERSVAATGQALLQGQPAAVQDATRELHDSAHALALALRGVDGGAALAGTLRSRLVRVAQDIAMQRQALLRRSAVVERAVQSLLPQARATTYASALGRYAGRAASSPVFRSV